MAKAIILAAGRGERLVNGKPYPKPLECVHGVPLIVRVLRGLEQAGVQEVAVVVGYLGGLLRAALHGYDLDIDVRFVTNGEWHKPNGTSLLKAGNFVDRPTFLLMSDHLWSPDLLDTVGRFPLAVDGAVLGVDYKISRCFDLADATKVQVRNGRVLRIGKELGSYDALDTGVFRITPAFIEALRKVESDRGCTLSQGVQSLAALGKMHVVDVGAAAWVDVDTPSARAHAERMLVRYGTGLGPTPQRDGGAVATV